MLIVEAKVRIGHLYILFPGIPKQPVGRSLGRRSINPHPTSTRGASNEETPRANLQDLPEYGNEPIPQSPVAWLQWAGD